MMREWIEPSPSWGIDEADSHAGQVSWIAPVARALLKARVGDEVALPTPAGTRMLEVRSVCYPDPCKVLSCGSPAIAALDGRAESRRLRRDSVGANHRLGAAQIPQSRLQMCLVTYRNNEPKVSGVQGGLVIHVHMGDVRFGVGQPWAIRASTPLPLMTVTTTPVSNRRVGSSAQSTAMKRSLSLCCKRLATLQSALCTTSPSPRPR